MITVCDEILSILILLLKKYTKLYAGPSVQMFDHVGLCLFYYQSV